MASPAQSLLVLTAIVAGLVAVIVFAVLRFVAAARTVKGPMRPERGEPSFVAAALEDSLQRLREQERLMKARAEESERLNSEIVAGLSSGLLVVGQDHAVRTINPAARRMLGRPQAEPGVRLRDLLSAALPLAEVIEACLSSGRPILRRELRIDGPGEAGTWYGVTVSPMAGGAAPAAIALFTDLTAVVALEEQLRIKDSLARLGELTAGLAHEFRNGLATIHGYARLIDPAQLPAEYQPYLQSIRDETDTLGRVVGNFLAFARPEQPAMARVALGDLASRTIEEFRAGVEARGGRTTLAGEFGTVMGDEVLLRQALSNLMRNAVEACAEAGVAPHVTVHGQVDREAREVRLVVGDNGPGVPPAARDKVFQPFFTTRSAGTGLGLSLVQKIIVIHNGRVALAASDEGGAAFVVTLPLLAAD
jgi:signal transduction histidine kinase